MDPPLVDEDSERNVRGVVYYEPRDYQGSNARRRSSSSNPSPPDSSILRDDDLAKVNQEIVCLNTKEMSLAGKISIAELACDRYEELIDDGTGARYFHDRGEDSTTWDVPPAVMELDSLREEHRELTRKIDFLKNSLVSATSSPVGTPGTSGSAIMGEEYPRSRRRSSVSAVLPAVIPDTPLHIFDRGATVQVIPTHTLGGHSVTFLKSNVLSRLLRQLLPSYRPSSAIVVLRDGTPVSTDETVGTTFRELFDILDAERDDEDGIEEIDAQELFTIRGSDDTEGELFNLPILLQITDHQRMRRDAMRKLRREKAERERERKLEMEARNREKERKEEEARKEREKEEERRGEDEIEAALKAKEEERRGLLEKELEEERLYSLKEEKEVKEKNRQREILRETRERERRRAEEKRLSEELFDLRSKRLAESREAREREREKELQLAERANRLSIGSGGGSGDSIDSSAAWPRGPKSSSSPPLAPSLAPMNENEEEMVADILDASSTSSVSSSSPSDLDNDEDPPAPNLHLELLEDDERDDWRHRVSSSFDEEVSLLPLDDSTFPGGVPAVGASSSSSESGTGGGGGGVGGKNFSGLSPVVENDANDRKSASDVELSEEDDEGEEIVEFTRGGADKPSTKMSSSSLQSTATSLLRNSQTDIFCVYSVSERDRMITFSPPNTSQQISVDFATTLGNLLFELSPVFDHPRQCIMMDEAGIAVSEYALVSEFRKSWWLKLDDRVFVKFRTVEEEKAFQKNVSKTKKKEAKLQRQMTKRNVLLARKAEKESRKKSEPQLRSSSPPRGAGVGENENESIETQLSLLPSFVLRDVASRSTVSAPPGPGPAGGPVGAPALIRSSGSFALLPSPELPLFVVTKKEEFIFSPGGSDASIFLEKSNTLSTLFESLAPFYEHPVERFLYTNKTLSTRIDESTPLGECFSPGVSLRFNGSEIPVKFLKKESALHIRSLGASFFLKRSPSSASDINGMASDPKPPTCPAEGGSVLDERSEFESRKKALNEQLQSAGEELTEASEAASVWIELPRGGWSSRESLEFAPSTNPPQEVLRLRAVKARIEELIETNSLLETEFSTVRRYPISVYDGDPPLLRFHVVGLSGSKLKTDELLSLNDVPSSSLVTISVNRTLPSGIVFSKLLRLYDGPSKYSLMNDAMEPVSEDQDLSGFDASSWTLYFDEKSVSLGWMSDKQWRFIEKERKKEEKDAEREKEREKRLLLKSVRAKALSVVKREISLRNDHLAEIATELSALRHKKALAIQNASNWEMRRDPRTGKAFYEDRAHEGLRVESLPPELRLVKEITEDEKDAIEELRRMAAGQLRERTSEEEVGRVKEWFLEEGFDGVFCDLMIEAGMKELDVLPSLLASDKEWRARAKSDLIGRYVNGDGESGRNSEEVKSMWSRWVGAIEKLGLFLEIRRTEIEKEMETRRRELKREEERRKIASSRLEKEEKALREIEHVSIIDKLKREKEAKKRAENLALLGVDDEDELSSLTDTDDSDLAEMAAEIELKREKKERRERRRRGRSGSVAVSPTVRKKRHDDDERKENGERKRKHRHSHHHHHRHRSSHQDGSGPRPGEVPLPDGSIRSTSSTSSSSKAKTRRSRRERDEEVLSVFSARSASVSASGEGPQGPAGEDGLSPLARSKRARLLSALEKEGKGKETEDRERVKMRRMRSGVADLLDEAGGCSALVRGVEGVIEGRNGRRAREESTGGGERGDPPLAVNSGNLDDVSSVLALVKEIRTIVKPDGSLPNGNELLLLRARFLAAHSSSPSSESPLQGGSNSSSVQNVPLSILSASDKENISCAIAKYTGSDDDIWRALSASFGRLITSASSFLLSSWEGDGSWKRDLFESVLDSIEVEEYLEKKERRRLMNSSHRGDRDGDVPKPPRSRHSHSHTHRQRHRHRESDGKKRDRDSKSSSSRHRHSSSSHRRHSSSTSTRSSSTPKPPITVRTRTPSPPPPIRPGLRASIFPLSSFTSPFNSFFLSSVGKLLFVGRKNRHVWCDFPSRFDPASDDDDSERSADAERSPSGESIRILDLSVSKTHLLILTESGLVMAYSWTVYPFLRTKPDSSSSRLAPVAKLEGIPFRRVVAGLQHSMALSTTGEVYSWGNPQKGRLGGNSLLSAGDDGIAPSNVIFPGDSRSVDIDCGDVHSVSLSKNGSVFIWGNVLSQEHNLYTIEKIPKKVGNLPEKSIIDIAAGAAHTIALTREGEIFCWGSNSFGQCGGESELQGMPLKVKFDGGNSGIAISHVKAGDHISVAIRSNGEVWAWGNNKNGLLRNRGGGGEEVIRSPILLKQIPKGVSIKAMSVTDDYITCIDESGIVRGWSTSPKIKWLPSDGSVGTIEFENDETISANLLERIRS